MCATGNAVQVISDWRRAALVHVVNFYLDETVSAQVKGVSTKARLDEKDQAMMQGFVLEALRASIPLRAV